MCANYIVYIKSTHKAYENCMFLGTRQKLLQLDKIVILIDNKVIEMIESHKHLGVIIDKHLLWDKQIDVICLNITRPITLLKLLSEYLDNKKIIACS